MKLLKKLSKTIIAFSLLTVFLTSCSSSSKEGLKSIPKDAQAVMIIDVFSLIKKGNLYKKDEYQMFKALTEEVKNEGKETSDLFKKISEDPSNTGIDFKKEVFGYSFNKKERSTYSCLSFKLDDESKFVDFVTKMLELQSNEVKIEEGNNYKYINLSGDSDILSWNKEKAIFVHADYSGREDIDFVVDELYDLKPEDQITANENFDSFYNKKKDVSFWVSSKIIEGNFLYRMVAGKSNIDISRSYLTAHLNFNDDDVELIAHVDPNEELMKKLNEYDILGGSFNDDILAHLPKKHLSTSGGSFKPEGILKLVEDFDDFRKMNKELKEETGFEVKDIIESLGGSVAFNISDFKNIEYEYTNYRDEEVVEEKLTPIISGTMDISKSDVFKKLFEKAKEKSKGEIVEKDGYYTLSDNNVNYYIGHNEKTMILTTDLNIITKFKEGKELEENLGDSDIASNFNKSPYYSYSSLNFDDYSEDVQKDFVKSKKNEIMVDVWDKITESIESKVIDKQTMDLKINTKGDYDNSFHALLKGIDASYIALEKR